MQVRRFQQHRRFLVVVPSRYLEQLRRPKQRSLLEQKPFQASTTSKAPPNHDIAPSYPDIFHQISSKELFPLGLKIAGKSSEMAIPHLMKDIHFFRAFFGSFCIFNTPIDYTLYCAFLCFIVLPVCTFLCPLRVCVVLLCAYLAATTK